MNPGKVYLVGAGPGDPGLVTVKGLKLLQQADVVIYDRLVSQRLLLEAKPEAEKIYVGKSSKIQQTIAQEEVDQLLIQKARAGGLIVRLKGGDPFVFGRGGEEALALVEAGIPYEVVPGVTSAIAAPAYAGIPVTHRGLSSSVVILTGHEDPAKLESSIQWEKLATAADTLVLLMGMETLGKVAEILLSHGLSPATPVAVTQWGTEPRQKTITGTLADIVEQVKSSGLGPPAVVVVGSVVKLRDKLQWFEQKPLRGKRVLVTRTRKQASRLVQLLLEEGAEPVEFPAIEVMPPEDWAPLDRAIGALSAFQWAAFTSVNGVSAFFERLNLKGLDARALAGIKVGAIGSATAQALLERGVRPDLVPETFLSTQMVKVLSERGLAGQRVLLPRSDIAPRELAQALEECGAQLQEVVAYRTVKGGSQEEAVAALQGPVDVATFTSSSTVHNLVDLLGGDLGPLKRAVIACIGPTTAQTARQLGLSVDVIAKEHTVPGLVTGLVEHIRQIGGS